MTGAATQLELGARAEAGEPPEARGLARDEVRMLVAHTRGERLEHARFFELAEYLEPGDLVVVNTSATLPAALEATRAGGERVTLHLSTPLSGPGARSGTTGYVVELRRGDQPLTDACAGERVELPAGASVRLESPSLDSKRLWASELRLPRPLLDYLGEHGRPISYGYLRAERPLEDYETFFGTDPGSAEMPSAGRPFTRRVVASLVAHGVAIAPITLHTGVSSLERGEAPYPEWFRVPPATARLVNSARSFGGRVVAVGTTAVRALESCAGHDGELVAREGLTRLVVTSSSRLPTVDGLITGWHDPDASHIEMLEAIGGRALIAAAYRVAAADRYLWHEFGDISLILREGASPARRAMSFRSRSGRIQRRPDRRLEEA